MTNSPNFFILFLHGFLHGFLRFIAFVPHYVKCEKPKKDILG